MTWEKLLCDLKASSLRGCGFLEIVRYGDRDFDIYQTLEIDVACARKRLSIHAGRAGLR
jgi:hypothetical protein